MFKLCTKTKNKYSTRSKKYILLNTHVKKNRSNQTETKSEKVIQGELDLNWDVCMAQYKCIPAKKILCILPHFILYVNNLFYIFIVIKSIRQHDLQSNFIYKPTKMHYTVNIKCDHLSGQIKPMSSSSCRVQQRRVLCDMLETLTLDLSIRWNSCKAQPKIHHVL